MARQTSILQLEGTIGDLCFYKTKEGYFVRRKSSVSRKRIKSDPAFQRTRENGSEFGRAAQAGKLFRSAFRSLIQRAGDNRVSNRLTSTFMKVIQEDIDSPRGQRNVKGGRPEFLEGFEFNENASLINTLSFNASIDRATGKMIVDIPAFTPGTMISAPERATHFRLFSGGAAIDFETNTSDLATAESAYLPISAKKIKPLRLIQKVKPRSSGTLFLLLGIELVQVVNKQQTPLSGMNALAVVKVSNR